MTSFTVYNDSDVQFYSRLILCIEERDSKTDPVSIDNRIFIGWCHDAQEYFVRGKRQDMSTSNYIPYAFQCKFTDDLYDFIEFLLGAKGKKSLTLYNYNNIYPETDLTYEFFEDLMNYNYEIAGYDNIKLSRHHIKKQLRLLKNIYNW